MIAGDAGDLSMARTQPWFVTNRRDIIRGLAPILGLAIAWSIWIRPRLEAYLEARLRELERRLLEPQEGKQ